jgi:hypothetical protein
MKLITTTLMLCALLAYALPSAAYLLPEYTIPSTDIAMTAEASLKKRNDRLSELGKRVNLGKLKRHKLEPKVKLSPAERKAAGNYRQLMDEIEFWSYVVAIKDDLCGLTDRSTKGTACAEADAIAKIIIETIYRLSREYRVGGSPLFHNFLINQGIRKGGHCYHYVGELQKALASIDIQHYGIHWGEAYAGTFRENNALVITARGAPFDTGIAIDAWRKGSRPFWEHVSDDRFPWVESSEYGRPKDSSTNL